MSAWRRWIVFVDGENLIIRRQEALKRAGVRLQQGPLHEPDTFLWAPGISATETGGIIQHPPLLQSHADRASYYTSLGGDEQNLKDVPQRLWPLGFDPGAAVALGRKKLASGSKY